MPTLQTLRGAPMHTMPLLGRTLTLYRQGATWGLCAALVTLVLFNLPWYLVPAVGGVVPPLIACVGFYLSAALMGSWTVHGVDAETASRRWL